MQTSAKKHPLDMRTFFLIDYDLAQRLTEIKLCTPLAQIPTTRVNLSSNQHAQILERQEDSKLTSLGELGRLAGGAGWSEMLIAVAMWQNLNFCERATPNSFPVLVSTLWDSFLPIHLAEDI